MMDIEKAEAIVKYCSSDNSKCSEQCPGLNEGCGGGSWAYIDALEIVKDNLEKLVMEYREKYEIAQDECVRLQTEDERMRCCYNCKDSNKGNHNSCKLSEIETEYCIDNNYKHWKPKEQK